MTMDRMPTIKAVAPVGGHALHLCWSDGTEADIDMARVFPPQEMAVFGDADVFAAVALGDWGHSLEWPNGIDIGADRLWLETLTAIGRSDTRRFLEWRLRNGLSLTESANALGLSRRTIAYYSNGERTIPKAILLACTGWDASRIMRKAA